MSTTSCFGATTVYGYRARMLGKKKIINTCDVPKLPKDRRLKVEHAVEQNYVHMDERKLKPASRLDDEEEPEGKKRRCEKAKEGSDLYIHLHCRALTIFCT